MLMDLWVEIVDQKTMTKSCTTNTITSSAIEDTRITSASSVWNYTMQQQDPNTSRRSLRHTKFQLQGLGPH